MAITNGYITLAEYNTRKQLTTDDGTPSDAGREAFIEDCIEAASRWIDNITSRRFYAATETRYFTARDYDLLFVDDLLAVTTLKTDDDGDRTYDTTWSTTDFDLLPFNAPLQIPPGPYTHIEITPEGVNTFPRIRRGIEIAGSWGYSTTAPEPIKEACFLLASRIYKRNDAIFGVAGPTQLGSITLSVPDDPDVRRLVAPYARTI